MKKSTSQVCTFIILTLSFFAATNATAAPNFFASPAQSQFLAASIVKVGYGGCGWDYPCAPRPRYGRYGRQFNYQYGGRQVNIGNNYGTVNIYMGHRPRYRYPHCGYYGCRYSRRYEGSNAYPGNRDYRPCGADPCYSRCSNYPCDENCGAGCWYRRFKTGYCGHGCDYYREKVRFEPRERVVEVPRPVYYRDPLPAPVVERRVYVEPSTSDVQAGDVESYPRNPYRGPEYP